jgi:hypothetical protein
MQLHAWLATVVAPIRWDILVTAPLLYHVSVVSFALTDRTGRTGDPGR